MYGSFLINSHYTPFAFHCSVQILSGSLRPNASTYIKSEPIAVRNFMIFLIKKSLKQLPLNVQFIVNEDVFLITCKSEDMEIGPGQVDEISKSKFSQCLGNLFSRVHGSEDEE